MPSSPRARGGSRNRSPAPPAGRSRRNCRPGKVLRVGEQGTGSTSLSCASRLEGIVVLVEIERRRLELEKAVPADEPERQNGIANAKRSASDANACRMIMKPVPPPMRAFSPRGDQSSSTKSRPVDQAKGPGSEQAGDVPGEVEPRVSRLRRLRRRQKRPAFRERGDERCPPGGTIRTSTSAPGRTMSASSGTESLPAVVGTSDTFMRHTVSAGQRERTRRSDGCSVKVRPGSVASGSPESASGAQSPRPRRDRPRATAARSAPRRAGRGATPPARIGR